MLGHKRKEIACAGLCLWLCHSCSSGSGTVYLDEIDRSGVRLGVTVGKITAFGSIFVDGTRFDTANTEISLNGIAVAESELRVGQVARIRGTREAATGSAETVAVDALLAGRLTLVDVLAKRLTVGGTTVVYNQSTVFKPDAAQLTNGQRVTVYGYEGVGATIEATRVETAAVSADLVLGVTSNVDSSNLRFFVRQTEVDYSSAELRGMSEVVEDARVRVTGEEQNGVLVAALVENVETAIAEDTEVEIEGVVTESLSNDEFSLGPDRIRIDSSTSFENGDAMNVVEGQELELTGHVEGALIRAVEITFVTEAATFLISFIDAVEGQTIDILGQSWTVDAETVLIDDTEESGQTFSVEDLRVGDWLKLDATTDRRIAKLKRIGAEDKTELHGEVTAVDPALGIVELSGVSVFVSSTAEYPEAGSQSVAEYLSSLTVGDGLKAEGRNDGSGTLNATKVEPL